MTFTQTRTSIPEEARKRGLLAVVIERGLAGARTAAAAIGRSARAVQGVVTPLGWSVIAAAIIALSIGYGWGLL